MTGQSLLLMGHFISNRLRVKTLMHRLPGSALCRGLEFKEVMIEMRKKGKGGNGKRQDGEEGETTQG